MNTNWEVRFMNEYTSGFSLILSWSPCRRDHEQQFTPTPHPRAQESRLLTFLYYKYTEIPALKSSGKDAADDWRGSRSSIFPTLRLPYVLTLTHPRNFYVSRVSWGVPRLQTRRSGTGNLRWFLHQTTLYEWAHECVFVEEPMCARCHGTYTSATSVLQVGGS